MYENCQTRQHRQVKITVQAFVSTKNDAFVPYSNTRVFLGLKIPRGVLHVMANTGRLPAERVTFSFFRYTYE